MFSPYHTLNKKRTAVQENWPLMHQDLYVSFFSPSLFIDSTAYFIHVMGFASFRQFSFTAVVVVVHTDSSAYGSSMGIINI